MTDLDKALATQVTNIVKRTGKTIPELTAIVKSSGLSKHGELVTMLKSTLGMGHGDANTLVHLVRKPGPSAAGAKGLSSGEVLDGLYTGPKATLRPIHDKLIVAIRKFGDFEEAPKKTYVSLRRNKQFGIVQPSTKTRIDVGIKLKGRAATERLEASGSFNAMVSHRVRVREGSELDAELIAWLRQAYEES